MTSHTEQGCRIEYFTDAVILSGQRQAILTQAQQILARFNNSGRPYRISEAHREFMVLRADK